MVPREIQRGLSLSRARVRGRISRRSRFGHDRRRSCAEEKKSRAEIARRTRDLGAISLERRSPLRVPFRRTHTQRMCAHCAKRSCEATFACNAPRPESRVARKNDLRTKRKEARLSFVFFKTRQISLIRLLSPDHIRVPPLCENRVTERSRACEKYMEF